MNMQERALLTSIASPQGRPETMMTRDVSRPSFLGAFGALTARQMHKERLAVAETTASTAGDRHQVGADAEHRRVALEVVKKFEQRLGTRWIGEPLIHLVQEVADSFDRDDLD